MMNTMDIPWLDKISLKDFTSMLKKNTEYKRVVGKVENSDSVGLPMFNKVFDDCCRGLERVPTQDEYAMYYVYVADTVIRENKLCKEQVKNRARRNIFSFIQEYAIYIVLRENNIEGLYDRVWDNKGVDFIINKDSNTTGLCVIADTKGAYNYTKLKNRHRRNNITFKTMSLVTRSNLCINCNGVGILPDLDTIRRCLIPNKIG